MANVCDFNEKPEIVYPIFWEYKIILDKDSDEKNVIKECVGNRNYTLDFSKNSAEGKFKSFNLAVLVNSDEERLELFSLLKRYSKFVL
ncbi:HP0495 family protein [Campylobacter fetus]|uniref:HP0495 family protein n=1 Tax=Campylobacter fetus TaxID=196 RepID=UPI000FCB6278|nr:DUF493 family protein [Campylobacter fetus]QQF52677.1 DUF493 family protein [Campylobacter fetus subsp. venerealis]RUT49502.1 DUF493 domain-containing protein [Campylobacter fetus]RUT49761.1 DUF493 domain-containing protein [Campylobacter fetus]